ncbi:MAG: DUF4383 domain-containing protein [Actinomycetota bacterium]|jgi:hypothetical protein
MDTSNPARLYALVFGAVLVAAGVIGFFYNSDFSSGDAVPRDAVFGILDVNGWHNVVHIATGALGLAAFASLAASRAYAFGLGVVYIIVAIWGFALGDGEVILNLVPINTADSVLHLAIGVIGIIAGLAGSTRAAPQRVSRAT